VIIEKQDYGKIISRYNSPDTFFYLDSLYYIKEQLYDREDADAFDKHEEIAKQLKAIKASLCFPTLMSHTSGNFTRV